MVIGYSYPVYMTLKIVSVGACTSLTPLHFLLPLELPHKKEPGSVSGGQISVKVTTLKNLVSPSDHQEYI